MLPWIRFYLGRDWLRGDGWLVYLCLFPAVHLMRRDEEGGAILAGFHCEAHFCWRSRMDRYLDRFSPRLSAWARSDVGEITRRKAALVGQFA